MLEGMTRPSSLQWIYKLAYEIGKGNNKMNKKTIQCGNCKIWCNDRLADKENCLFNHTRYEHNQILSYEPKIINNHLKFKIKEITGDGIYFTNGYKLEHYHEQDCCEHVYADWSNLKDLGILDDTFDDIKIEKVKDAGFRINKYFVPCYNNQSGYYSSALDLIGTDFNGVKIRISLTGYTENNEG